MDTDRLDFMIAHSAWVQFSNNHEHCMVWQRGIDGTHQPMDYWPVQAYNTPREAIDGAMRAYDRKVNDIIDHRVKRLADAEHPAGFFRGE